MTGLLQYKKWDRVRESTITTGTGDITLAGAEPGFRAFSAVAANGDQFGYVIEAQSPGAFETGLGHYNTSANTITRETVLSSSNAGALTNFAAGTKYIYCAPVADSISRLIPIVPAFPVISNLKLRLSAEFSTLTLNTDDRVAQVNDFSGNWAGNFTAGTTARPRWRRQAFNYIRPAFVFDGISNRLTSTVTKTIAQPISFVVVLQNWRFGLTNANLFRDENSLAVAFINGSGAAPWAIFAGTGLTSQALFDQNRQTMETGQIGAPAILIAVFNGGSSVLSNNGVEVTGAAGSSGINGTLRVGSDASTSFAAMEMYEFLIFDKALSAGERGQINNYYAQCCDIRL